MFCYMYVSHYSCVVNELCFWSNTAKEHQTFLLTVAALTDKKLSNDLERQLSRFHNEFAGVEEEVEEYSKNPFINYLMYQKLVCLIKKFLIINLEFIRILQSLKKYGQTDKVWQTLVEHIEDEQKYMDRLLKALVNQLIY